LSTVAGQPGEAGPLTNRKISDQNLSPILKWRFPKQHRLATLHKKLPHVP